MLALWLQFAGVVVSQALLFLAFVWWFSRENLDSLAVLLWSAVLALPFGFVVDIVVGEWMEVFAYTFGMQSVLFYILNAAFSYGVMFATVYLILDFAVWKLAVCAWCIGVVYEFVNYLLPVWEWRLAEGAWLEYLLVVGFGYPVLLFSMWLSWRVAVWFSPDLFVFRK